MRDFFDLGMTIVCAVVLGLFAIAVASSHDWYPLECCSGMDCAPVEEASSSVLYNAGTLSYQAATVRTRYGTAIVPADFKTRTSPDGQMHACIHNGKLLCLFMPPGS